MLEIAIISIKCALRDDFPEFMEFYNNREWEKKNDNTESLDSADSVAVSENESSEADVTDSEAKVSAEKETLDDSTVAFLSSDDATVEAENSESNANDEAI